MTDSRPQGIDVSHYQGDVRVELGGCAFAFAQATVGTWDDPTYLEHLDEFHAADVVRGAYHYLVCGPGPTRQAQAFLSRVGDAEILAADTERAILHYPQVIREFIVDVRRSDTRRRPILLYSSRGTWPGPLLQSGNWVADYVTTPDTPQPPLAPVEWLFWQKSGSQPADRDEFNGTLAQLHKIAGRAA